MVTGTGVTDCVVIVVGFVGYVAVVGVEVVVVLGIVEGAIEVVVPVNI